MPTPWSRLEESERCRSGLQPQGINLIHDFEKALIVALDFLCREDPLLIGDRFHQVEHMSSLSTLIPNERVRQDCQNSGVDMYHRLCNPALPLGPAVQTCRHAVQSERVRDMPEERWSVRSTFDFQLVC